MSMKFNLENYSFDTTDDGIQRPTLRVFGTCENSFIEMTITNPTQEIIYSLMSAYDRRYGETTADIRLIGRTDAD